MPTSTPLPPETNSPPPASGVSSRSFFILGLCLIIGLTVFGCLIERAVMRGREFDRFLSVRGLSEKEVLATLAIWPLRFSVLAEDLTTLKTRMEQDRATVIQYLVASGINTNEITLGLPEVRDREDERIQLDKPNLPRFRGVVTLVVRSPSVAVVKKAIQGADALLASGVTLADNEGGDKIDFLFDDVNKVKPDMIREATANARAAAEKFAQDSHSKVGQIRRATQGIMEIEDRDAASPERKVLRVVTTVDFFLQ